MSRNWQPPRKGKWLSPEAFNALNPAEKRALQLERKVRRHEARYAPRPARYRKGYYARQRLIWMVGSLVVMAGLTHFDLLPMPSSTEVVGRAPLDTLGTNGVRASFGFCHSGGGYNCVVDGDTIWLEGQNIRIAGIDAPETHDYGCASEKELGDRTTRRLRELVNSGAVSLSSIDRDEDVYGRKLRNVAVDGRDVGDVLVSEGLAREYAGGRRSWCG